ncbi:MAG: CoB--CoM heterodisulfide reductase iron-sulfur subunit C [Methanomassiliicoccales archaeon PtaU1.Bin124]|nr:MAG: CoB--CoM heterodisulfide reductase iron-sulfur subunit C [Methanomassiliicoccales archaeon PtaU1.Bin124]
MVPPELDPIDERVGPQSGLNRCMQCGKCTASCPAAFIFEGFSPRDIMLRAMKGEIESLVMGEELWQCAQCLSCAARCPRDCSPAGVIQALRIVALRSNPNIDHMRMIEDGVKVNLMKTGQTILPDTLVLPNDLLGPRTRKRYKASAKHRRELGYRAEDSRRVEIPEEDLEKIRILLRETDYC